MNTALNTIRKSTGLLSVRSLKASNIVSQNLSKSFFYQTEKGTGSIIKRYCEASGMRGTIETDLACGCSFENIKTVGLLKNENRSVADLYSSRNKGELK